LVLVGLVGFGWFWLVLVGFGWFWLVLGGFRWFWLLVLIVKVGQNCENWYGRQRLCNECQQKLCNDCRKRLCNPGYMTDPQVIL
jgi:hypothetical protein